MTVCSSTHQFRRYPVNRLWLASGSLALGLVLSTGSTVQAVSFNFTYNPDVSSQFVNGFTTAGNLWSQHLNDDVKLNIHIELDGLPDGILGGARPGMVRVNYNDFLTAAFRDQVSASDALAFNSLQLNQKGQDLLKTYNLNQISRNEITFDDKNSFAMLVDGSVSSSSNNGNGQANGHAYIDQDGNDNNRTIWLTRANAKAIGLIPGNNAQVDATIRISSSALWDFDRSNGTSPDAYDFLSVAQHEIGHVLGFVSGVDVLNVMHMSAAGTSTSITDTSLTYVSPMDLFRYSEASSKQGVFDWSMTGDKYFSIDGGRTSLAAFATGASNDDYQSSHWANQRNPLGIMNPILEKGQQLNISTLDLQLLDVVGWDRHVDLATSIQVIGLNWNNIRQGLAQSRQEFFAQQLSDWQAIELTPEQIQALQLLQQSTENKLTKTIESTLTKLASGLAKETDPAKRAALEAKAQAQIAKLTDTQERSLAQMVRSQERMTTLRLNQQMLEWLSLAPDDLRAKLMNAQGIQIKGLAKVVLNANSVQSSRWKENLLKALGPVTENPDEALQKLLAGGGTDDPLSRTRSSSGSTTYRFWQTAASNSTTDASDPYTFYSTSASSTGAVSVPEPGSVACLIVIALGGLGSCCKRRCKTQF